jgi:hypothetical protein
MLKCYVIRHRPTTGQRSFGKEIHDIITTNPDRIFCECLDEQDWQIIFKGFLDLILPWVREHNKVIEFLVPDIGNTKMDNVETYPTVGVMLISANDAERWITQSHNAGLEGRYISNRFPRIQYPLLFTCYANRYSPERLKLIDALARENLLNEGIVTCHFTSSIEREQWKYHDGSMMQDPEEPDFVLHSKPEYSPSVLPKSYFKGFFDIIPESRWADNEFLTTEKTIKSIINYKPFLVLSSKGFHTEFLAKRMGYQLYDEMFDYSFDTCNNIDDRIEGIVENVKRLRDKLSGPASFNNKYDLIGSITKKLYFNRAKFFDIIYDPEKTIPKCLQFVRETDDYEFYGDLDGSLFTHMRQMNWIKL